MKFKNTRKYIERDPFNPENLLECEISMDKDHRYGALTIHKINGNKLAMPQIIYGTPKLKYPFDRNGNWHFPSAARILSYRKYDGTNIFMYRYKYKEQYYTTYKVRLFPFLRGVILDLWKKCLKEYKEIKGLFSYFPNMSGFSFEMYGKDNPHLIEYDHDLKVRLLFGLKQSNYLGATNVKTRSGNYKFGYTTESKLEIVPIGILSNELDSRWEWMPDLGIPFAEKLDWYSRDYIYNYLQEKENHEKDLIVTEKGFKGHEGSIWYFEDRKGTWHLFKCKPESIEKIHWAAYPLDVNVIKATAINVLEVYDTVDYDSLCELLLEEYPQQQIDLSEKRIYRVLEELDQKEQFKRRVKFAMEDLDANLSIVDILRQLSNNFTKQEMKSVYKCVVELMEE